MYNSIKPKRYLRTHKVPKQSALIYGSTTVGQRGGLLLRIPTVTAAPIMVNLWQNQMAPPDSVEPTYSRTPLNPCLLVESKMYRLSGVMARG